MITFIITKDDINKNFECSMEDSILSLKNKIIKEFDITTNYIDLEFILERPIRSLGKFNLESGIIPRPLDSYKFDRYGLDGKTVNATYHIVNDFQPKKYERVFKHVNLSQKYKNEKLEKIETEENIFDINSESDFPSLG
jgi:hypothetical protein